MIIEHRINTIQHLIKVPESHGVEIDLRTQDGQLVLAHDPYLIGESFEKWLDYFKHKTLILNVKEDGLENSIIKLLNEHSVSSYFFLDQPFPSLRRTAIQGIPTALRLSEYENAINSLALNIEWSWLDSFHGDWSYLHKHAEWIRTGRFKTCVVSPELQGRNLNDEPQRIMSVFTDLGLTMDAVCTKFPDVWSEVLK
jgi:hypothetical protein